MKRILIGTVALIMTLPAFGDDGDKTTTSKPYVDTQIETTQVKIPAAGAQGVGEGTSVITYTNTAGGGVIGERELFTGGEYDADSDSGKLITASALNNTFTNLPTTDTTKLVCANQSDGCTLWTITDQTAYGISGNGTTTIDLMSLIGNVAGEDYGYISNDGSDRDNNGQYSLTQNGTWVVDYGNGKRIRGKAQCSSRAGATYTWDNGTYNTISSNFTPTLPDASGDNCYCQLDGYTTNGDNWGNMTALSAPWVFYYAFGGSCAYECAYLCASRLWGANAGFLAFRAAVFGSVQ